MLHELEEKLRESLREFRDKVEQLGSESDLNDLKGRLIGKKGGRVTEVLSAFGKLTPEERAKIGQLANSVKQEIEAGLKARLQKLKQSAPAGEFIDLTLDPAPPPWGARHPITRVRQDIEEFFIPQGYAVVKVDKVLARPPSTPELAKQEAQQYARAWGAAEGILESTTMIPHLPPGRHAENFAFLSPAVRVRYGDPVPLPR